jgi:hypothetical protein
MVSTRRGEADVGAGHERDVGEVRAARVRVVENEDIVRARLVRAYSRDRVG